MMHVGRATNFNFSHGEQACYKANTCLPSNCGVHCSWVILRNGYGSAATQHNNVSRRGADKGDAEADQMEFEGGGEIPATF